MNIPNVNPKLYEKCTECDYLRTEETQAGFNCGEKYCLMKMLGISEAKLQELRYMCWMLDAMRNPVKDEEKQ
jgi:hypothetical protein